MTSRGERPLGGDVVNSRAYWDGRFEGDWELRGGPAQSRWFAELALDHAPAWLLSAVAAQRLTVVDWGCAQGDGTAAWASRVAAGHLIGVDFSTTAIATARARHPDLRFVHEDWLAEHTAADGYDLVFSSNTLEHFAAPEVALTAIARRARKAVLLLVPYREEPLDPEHCVAFVPALVPARLSGNLVLQWSKVLDCRAMAGAHYAGQQLLVLYTDPAWTYGLVTSLADLDSGVDTLRDERDRLHRQLQETERALAVATTKVASLEARLHGHAERERRLADRVRVLEERHARKLSTRLYRRWRALTDRRG